MMATVKELQELFKDDMWIKSPGGRDVLDEHKYQQAFPRSSKRNHESWLTEASRAVECIKMNHLDLADMITEVPNSFFQKNFFFKVN